MTSETRGRLLALAGLVAVTLVVIPAGWIGTLEHVMPTRAARILAPLSAAVLGGWAAVTAANDRRASTAMSDRWRTTAAITGGIAVAVGVSLALLGLMSGGG